MSEKEFIANYQMTLSSHWQRATDLNSQCLKMILTQVMGKSILDVGCGRAHVAHLCDQKYAVTATDIHIDPQLPGRYPRIRFVQANAEHLPFRDRNFDTVICTHTLEHVQNIQATIQELRRVATKRLIIVVPRQRPYRYTFDLHLHFFPYPFTLMMLMGPGHKSRCESVGGDLLYVEDISLEHSGRTPISLEATTNN